MVEVAGRGVWREQGSVTLKDEVPGHLEKLHSQGFPAPLRLLAPPQAPPQETGLPRWAPFLLPGVQCEWPLFRKPPGGWSADAHCSVHPRPLLLPQAHDRACHCHHCPWAICWLLGRGPDPKYTVAGLEGN